MPRHSSEGTLHQLSVGGNNPPANSENTYKMEPRRKFKSHLAKRVLVKVVKKWINDDTKYSSELGGNYSTAISQDVLQQLKTLNFDRYRYVVQTYIGEKRRQGLQVSTRAVFDSNLDSFAEYVFENNSLWCVTVVHGIYFE